MTCLSTTRAECPVSAISVNFQVVEAPLTDVTLAEQVPAAGRWIRPRGELWTMGTAASEVEASLSARGRRLPPSTHSLSTRRGCQDWL